MSSSERPLLQLKEEYLKTWHKVLETSRHVPETDFYSRPVDAVTDKRAPEGTVE